MKTVDLRRCLESWPYDEADNVRSARGADGREIILVREPMGLQQYEMDGRPDGLRVQGMESAFAFHQARLAAATARELSAEDCARLIHEGIETHHRLLLFFRLKEWARAERDSAQNLRLIEFIRRHARCEEDRVHLDPWHPGLTRIHAVARAMMLLEEGRHRELRDIPGDLARLIDDAPDRARLAEEFLASVQDCLVDFPAHRTNEASLFQKQDDYWTIAYQDYRALLKTTRGLQCLGLLLRYPGREFHVSELLAHSMQTAASSATAKGCRNDAGPQLVIAGLYEGGAMLDAHAKAQCKHRLEELREDIREAEQRNDTHRAAKARKEMDTIVQHLASAIGLGGRDRKSSSDAERARSAVTKRIKQAIHKIAETIPSLGHHLTGRIKTGYFCSSNPHPDRPVAWKF